MKRLSVREITVFAMLAALMYASKELMAFLPNIHLLGVFITATTVVYRRKALYPLYLFVLVAGIFAGFSTWWLPYLYIWTVLWGGVMLLPQRLPQRLAPFIYAGVSGLHGLLYGTLYAPFQALVFGTNAKGTLAWILAGLPYDAVHGAGNFIGGALLIPPLIALLRRAQTGFPDKN